MYRGKSNSFRGRGGSAHPPSIQSQPFVEEAPYPKAPKKGRSSQQRSRDSKRRDEFRESGAPIRQKEQEIKDLINKTLFFGFAEAHEAQTKQEFTTITTAVTLPVSTRVIGLTTQAVFSKAYNVHRNIPACTPWAFYRVSLGQMELKLLAASRYQVLPTGGGQEHLFVRPQMDNDFKDLIRSAAVNIAPITNTLHAVGNFVHAGKSFYVKPMNHPFLGILLSNLREVVTSMADANTPLAIRQSFYDCNPLPYASWTTPVDVDERRRRRIPAGAAAGNPNHPLLLNADEIMPAIYDAVDLERDIVGYQNFLSHLGRKSSSMLSGPCAIDYNGVGQKRLLTSNYCEGLRNPPAVTVLGAIGPDQYRLTEPPTGDLSEFWTSEPLETGEMFVGAMNLLGEIPAAALMNRAQATRCEYLATQRANHRFTAILNNMLG